MRKNVLLLTLLSCLVVCFPILAAESEKPKEEREKGEQTMVDRNLKEEQTQPFRQRWESMSEEERRQFRERMRERFERRRKQQPTRSVEDDDHGLTPLHHAVVKGDIELVKSFCTRGVSAEITISSSSNSVDVNSTEIFVVLSTTTLTSSIIAVL